MLRPIVLYPDPRLKLKSKPVTKFGPELVELAADMTETMRSANPNRRSHPHDGDG
jgi:peptide deformylase